MSRAALQLVGTALLALLLAVTVQFMLPGVAMAQALSDDTAVGGAVGSYGVGDWAGLALRLLLVLGTIWGAVLAMKWYVRRVNGEATQLGRQLQVLESRSLGPNRSLHLVRLSDRAVLLGVTAERINSLLTIEDAEEVERLATAATAARENKLRAFAGGMTGVASASLRNAFARPAPAPVVGEAPSGEGRVGSGESLGSRARQPRGANVLASLALRVARAVRPVTRPGSRRTPRAPRPFVPQPALATLPREAPTSTFGTPALRAQAAAAYGREDPIAAARRAILNARGEG